MNLCIYITYFSISSFMYKFLQDFLCVYVLIACSSKHLRGITSWMLGMLQYVEKRMKEFSRVAWPNLYCNIPNIQLSYAT
jgi:hypothetical protein